MWLHEIYITVLGLWSFWLFCFVIEEQKIPFIFWDPPQSLFSAWLFSLYRFLASLVRLILKYFTFVDTIMKGIISLIIPPLIFLTVSLLLVYRHITDFWVFYSYHVMLPNLGNSGRSLFVIFLESSMQRIMSSAIVII